MNACFAYLAISLFSVVSAKDLDEDMLLYWRRTDSSKCEPFTTYFISCNKCVCSADGTSFCTRMACFKARRFLTGGELEGFNPNRYYQVCKNSSPANDLLYLIFNCTDPETRVKCYYDWIDNYHSELDRSLSYYGLKANYVYPRNQLDADLKRYGKLAFGCSILISGVLNLKPEQAGNLKQAFASTEADAVIGAIGNVPDDTRSFIKKKVTGLVDSCLTFGLL